MRDQKSRSGPIGFISRHRIECLSAVGALLIYGLLLNIIVQSEILRRRGPSRFPLPWYLWAFDLGSSIFPFISYALFASFGLGVCLSVLAYWLHAKKKIAARRARATRND